MKDKKISRCDVLLVGCEEEENLGLRSIAAFLTKHGIRVKIEPYHLSLKENIRASASREKPKIVGFSLIFQRMFFEFAHLMAYLRQKGVTAHFTMGGHFPTLEFKGCLELIPELDSIVRHEGEQTLLELFHRLDQPNSWTQIKGLAYRRDGKIMVNPPRPLIQNLDSLPYPLRSDRVATHRGLGISSILASRGCYYNCSFCSIREFYREPPGLKRRSRSPSNVAQEMKQLFIKRGTRIFIFKDDDLPMKGRMHRQWIRDFVHELKKRNITDSIVWRISSRVDDLDAELIEEMKEAGLISLYLGIESGSNQGLRTFNKQYTVDDIYKALRTLQKSEMPFEFGFMIFDPDSTMDSMKENIGLLREICRDGQAVVHFTKMFPYAGTPIARRLRKEGRLKGTIASPDYSYNDPRLDLLQLFFSQTFHSRNFDPNGLVNRLQMAKFDAIILDKFFSDRYDAKAYFEATRQLTSQSNDSALETMSLAVNFMENRDAEEILYNWHVLQYLSQKELDMELRTAVALNQLMSYYDFEIMDV